MAEFQASAGHEGAATVAVAVGKRDPGNAGATHGAEHRDGASAQRDRTADRQVGLAGRCRFQFQIAIHAGDRAVDADGVERFREAGIGGERDGSTAQVSVAGDVDGTYAGADSRAADVEITRQGHTRIREGPVVVKGCPRGHRDGAGAGCERMRLR